MPTRTRSPHQRPRGPRTARALRHAASAALLLTLAYATVTSAQSPAPAAPPTAPAAPTAATATPAAAPPATAAPPSEAQVLFEDGVAALRAGRHEQAMNSLNKSYALQQHAATLYNLGIAYQALRSPALAVEAWEAYLGLAKPEKDAQRIAAVKREIERVTGLMARFALTVQPVDATIMIDGVKVRRFKNELWVEPGSRRIAVTAPGFEDFEQPLVVQAGRFSLDIKLRRPEGAPADVAARLLVEGERLVQGGNTADGVAKLEQSYKLAPTPHTAGALGLAAETLGRLGQAQDMVLVALSERSDPWVKSNKRALRLAKRRLVGKTATLFIAGPDYPGADVEVNGRSVGKLPLSDGGRMRVAEGAVNVKAHLTGHDSYTVDIDVRAQTEVRVSVLMYKSKPKPVTPVLVPITTWPVAPVVAPPPAPVVATPEAPAPEPEPEEGPSQADIEALSQAYEAEPPDEHETVRGLEMQLDVGYQFWLGDGLADTNGGFAAHLLSFGFRPHWLVSFGVQLIDAQFTLPGDERKVVSSASVGGLYVRMHSQKERKELAWDFWGGLNYQPVSMGLAVYEAEDLSIQDATEGTTGGDLVQNQIGVGDTVSQQTMNVALELGATFYLTETFGLTLNGQLKRWYPLQECYHDSSDRLCYDDGLKQLNSLYLGAGMSFLP